ncbi:hypothetical protein [Treponema sp. SP13]
MRVTEVRKAGSSDKLRPKKECIYYNKKASASLSAAGALSA